MYLPLLLLLIQKATSYGRCGPDNYIPTEAVDCVNYSNETHICCYLKMLDSPADYQICYSMEKTNLAPIISNGKLTYTIDCTGIDDYDKLFPLESLYRPCGVQNPSVPGDCWPYSSGYGACCMAGDNYNMEGDPFCYYFPDDHFEKQNFTVQTLAGETYFVACHCRFLYFNVFWALIFCLVAFL